MQLLFHDKKESLEISLEKEKGEWLLKILDLVTVQNEKTITFAQLKTDFEMQFDDFELFWFSKSMMTLRTFGLLVL